MKSLQMKAWNDKSWKGTLRPNLLISLECLQRRKHQMDLSVKCLSKSTAFKAGVHTSCLSCSKRENDINLQRKPILPITLKRLVDEKSADKIKQVYISDTTEYFDGLMILQKIWNLQVLCLQSLLKMLLSVYGRKYWHNLLVCHEIAMERGRLGRFTTLLDLSETHKRVRDIQCWMNATEKYILTLDNCKWVMEQLMRLKIGELPKKYYRQNSIPWNYCFIQSERL